MASYVSSSTIEKYNRFSLAADKPWNDLAPNLFQKVSVSEIQSLEMASGFKVPDDFRDFLLEIGWGRLTLSSDGRSTTSNLNVFMHPIRILEILSMESLEWSTGEDFCDEDEIPFFDIGNFSVFVFRGKTGATGPVYRPYLVDPVAPSFEVFLNLLFDDAEFYNRNHE
jgi:SMI1 / KNR4 family (SUKH-1)